MFIRSSPSSVRGRALLLAALPLLSLLTLFTPFFTQKAYAVTPDEVLNSARAWSILNAIIDKRDLIDSTISTSDAQSCHIFGFSDKYYVEVGHHVTGNNNAGSTGPTDGATWSNLEDNVSAANSALASVGITGGCRGLLEKIGYTFNGGDLQQPGDFGDKLSERLRNALKPNAFFGAKLGDGSPGNALSYAMLHYNLTNVCGWSYRNPYVANDAAQTLEGSRNREAQSNGATGEETERHYHTYTYENGRAGDNTYFRNQGTDNDVSVGSKTGFAPSGDNDARLDCGDNNADTFGAKLADNHRFADAYFALVKPGGDATAGTCGDRYGPTGTNNAADLAACDAGFNNKTNPTYCNNHYPNGGATASQFAACRYGQTTATGGANTTTPLPGSSEDTGKGSTCKIDGIGWIVCPVVTFLAKITDGAYTIVASLLEVQPLNVVPDDSNGLFRAWSIMRNFANVAFVIFFLIIIFSQLTSVGINNYGIKKLLPKLIVAAILVNVSYWVCAIAVDVSNILGGSLNGLLGNLAKDTGITPAKFGAIQTGEGWVGLAGGLLAGTLATGALLYIGLSVLLPMLVVVLATIVTVFLALVLRQALIIILIVASPLAFVAYLLPNTEDLFKKWLTTFKLLLVIYPVVAIIFGGSALASAIIMASAPNTLYIQIAGAAAAVIPLVAAPALIKAINGVTSRFGLPGVGVRLGGLQKRAEGLRDTRRDIARTRRLGRAERVLEGTGGVLGGEGTRRRRVAAWIRGSGASAALNREQREANAKRALSEAKQDYVVGRASAAAPAGAAYAKSIAGPTGDAEKIIASAKEAKIKEFNAQVAAEKATLSRITSDTFKDTDGRDTSVLVRMIRDSSLSSVRRSAAASQLMEKGSDQDIMKTLDYLGTANVTADPDLRDVQQQVGGDIGRRKPISLGAKDGTALSAGTYSGDFASKIASRIAGGKLNAEKLASASADELNAIRDYLTANSAAMKTDPKTAASMKALEDSINAYRSNKLINQPAHEIADVMDTIHGLL